MNPYHEFVTSLARLVADGKSLPLGVVVPHRKPGPPLDAPVALIFSPHPDDECIVGGFALRLLREAGIRRINVRVTLGRKKERPPTRLAEIKKSSAPAR